MLIGSKERGSSDTPFLEGPSPFFAIPSGTSAVGESEGSRALEEKIEKMRVRIVEVGGSKLTHSWMGI
jgi:hypothetical protein